MPLAAVIKLSGITPNVAQRDSVEPWILGGVEVDSAEPWDLGVRVPLDLNSVEPWDIGSTLEVSSVEPWDLGVNIDVSSVEPWNLGGNVIYTGTGVGSPLLGWRDR